jgi:hypothetical protein
MQRRSNRTLPTRVRWQLRVKLGHSATLAQCLSFWFTHTRKMDADDAFDTVSGSHGLTGAADTILVLKRHVGGVTLHATGRDIAVVRFRESCRWMIVGKPPGAAEVRMSEERQRVLQALTEAGETMSLGFNFLGGDLFSGEIAEIKGDMTIKLVHPAGEELKFVVELPDDKQLTFRGRPISNRHLVRMAMTRSGLEIVLKAPHEL